jgi:hypothetical protein
VQLVELLVYRASAGSVSLLSSSPTEPAASLVSAVPPGVDPVRHARSACEASLGTPSFLHSTSWRYEHGATYLTFAAVLDGEPTAQLYPSVVDAYSPGGSSVADVSSHAVRHLAHLNKSGEFLLEPEWTAALRAHDPILAGEVEHGFSARVVARVTCVYASSGESSAAWTAAKLHSPHAEDFPPVEVLREVDAPTATFSRLSADYVRHDHRVADYDVERAVITDVAFNHLPPCTAVTLEIGADSPDGIIQAAKDLYDPETTILFNGRELDQDLPPARGFTGNHRGIVVHVLEGVPSMRRGAVRSTIQQLLAKELAVDYAPIGGSAIAPDDLNSPEGAEIVTWAESTVVWRLPPRLHGWVDGLIRNTALVVSLRQLCDNVSSEIRREQVDSDEERAAQILNLSTLRSRFSRATAGDVDGHLVRAGIQQRQHVLAVLDHSGSALARDRTEKMLNQHLETLQVEHTVSAQAGSRDLVNVVRVFAVVTVLLSALSVGQAASEPAAAGTFGTAVAAAMAVLSISVALAAGMAFTSTRTPPARHRLLLAVGLLLLTAAVALFIIRGHDSLRALGAITPIGLCVAGVGAILVAWSTRLGRH